MKSKCPKCEGEIELDPELHEEGDSVECEECGAELFVVMKGKKLSVAETFEEEDEEELQEVA